MKKYNNKEGIDWFQAWCKKCARLSWDVLFSRKQEDYQRLLGFVKRMKRYRSQPKCSPTIQKKRDNLNTKNMTNMDWNYEPVTTINLQYPLVSFGESRAVITLKIGEQRESGTYIGFSIKWNIRLRFPNDSHCLLNH